MAENDSDTWPALERPPTEVEKVESWRLHVLVEAGYPVALAEQLAAKFREVDVHQAVALVDSGCPPTLAAEILL